MMKNSLCGDMKPERKLAERKRRVQMKGLCFKLGSLIPPHFLNSCSADSASKGSQQDVLDAAALYIKQLAERVEKLEATKEEALDNLSRSTSSRSSCCLLPAVELKHLGSGIEVILISDLLDKKNFLLHQLITILQQEGAEVVSASFSTISDKVFYVVHAQVKISRLGIEISSVREKLHELMSYL